MLYSENITCFISFIVVPPAHFVYVFVSFSFFMVKSHTLQKLVSLVQKDLATSVA